jgi:hypothetical protein
MYKYLYKNIFIPYPDSHHVVCCRTMTFSGMEPGTKNGFRADCTEAGVQRRCDSYKV